MTVELIVNVKDIKRQIYEWGLATLIYYVKRDYKINRKLISKFLKEVYYIGNDNIEFLTDQFIFDYSLDLYKGLCYQGE